MNLPLAVTQEELLEHAKLALCAAKDSGKDCCKFYVNSHEKKYAKQIIHDNHLF